MPGATTHLSLRYPLVTEVVTAQSYLDLANDIDTQFTVTDGIRQLNLHKDTCNVSGGTTVAAVNTFVNFGFTSSAWTKPAALHSTSVNPEQFVIQTAGLYLFITNVRVSGPFTTLTGTEIGQSKNGTSNYLETGISQLTGGNAQVRGLQFCNVGDILRTFVRWTGTGGPSNVSGEAQLFMIAQL